MTVLSSGLCWPDGSCVVRGWEREQEGEGSGIDGEGRGGGGWNGAGARGDRSWVGSVANHLVLPGWVVHDAEEWPGGGGSFEVVSAPGTWCMF